MAVEVVDWSAYFQHIRKECPWSWQAYQQGLIWVGPWQNRKLTLDVYQARVYVVKNINRRLLKKCADKYNSLDTEDEWLWSHPGSGRYSTPVPSLIQQNKRKLQEIRLKLNLFNK